MPETIQIPRAWLEELITLSDCAEECKGECCIKTLCEHIESAKSLLDK